MARQDADDRVRDPASGAAAPRPRRGRPPKDPEPRRRQLIAAALDLFIANGYAATNLDEVGKAAGLTKRTIYELVGDKEQLFREACRYSNSTLVDVDFSDTLDDRSLRASLTALGTRLVEHALAERTIALERLIIAESRRFPELIEEIVKSGHLEGNQKISAYLTDLQSRGMIALDDIWTASELFYDLIAGQIGFRRAMGYTDLAVGPEHVESRVDAFLTIYAGRSPIDFPR